MSKDELLDRIVQFLSSIDIRVVETEVDATALLPGFEIGADCILMDRSKVLYPGDLLHEAGHLAVTEAVLRPLIGTEHMDASWPTEGDEIAAILWSYAAALKMQLDLRIIFHESGYKNDSDWIIQQFDVGNYIGLPFLEWMGLCYSPENAAEKGEEAFPHMVRWKRAC